MPWSLRAVGARCRDAGARLETAPGEGGAPNPSNWVGRVPSEEQVPLTHLGFKGAGPGMGLRPKLLDALRVQFSLSLQPRLGLGEVRGLT